MTELEIELLGFAKDGNADQLFALIEDECDFGPEKEIANRYENAQIDDAEFCNAIVSLLTTGEYFRPPSVLKKFVVVMCNQEEWDEPHICIVDAIDEEEAQLKAEKEGGFEEGEVDEMLEDGSIYVEIKEVVNG